MTLCSQLYPCYNKYLESAPNNMKFKTDKSMAVFNRKPNGEPGGFSVIEKGEYIVRKIQPFDNSDSKLTWYKIKGTKFVFAFNLKNLPEGISLQKTFHRQKTLLLK